MKNNSSSKKGPRKISKKAAEKALLDAELNIENDTKETVSKSQLKRDADYLQDLGEKLLTLSTAELKKIPLPDNLLDALKVAQKILNKRGALKRQKQFIGKIMRNIDEKPIIEALDELEGQNEVQIAYLHRIEKLRDMLMTNGNNGIGELASLYENIDRQHIRQLVKKAQKDIENNKQSGAYKAIFKYLKELTPLE